MAEVTCVGCGARISLALDAAAPSTAVTCPKCKAVLQVEAPDGDGVATVFNPAASRAEDRVDVESGDGPLDPYRTGTILLKSDGGEAPVEALEVKFRGYLTQEGLPPGEGNFRLRGASNVVGRVDGDLHVEDPAISGRHFAIEERGAEFFLRDLESSNGTFLNGHRVRATKLSSGDRIRAGNTTFTFSVRHVIPMGE